MCQHGGSSAHDAVFNGLEPSDVKGFLNRWPHPNAVRVSSGSTISNLAGHSVMKAARSLQHAVGHHPGLASMEQHGLAHHLVEEAHNVGGNSGFDQHPSWHAPSAVGLH